MRNKILFTLFAMLFMAANSLRAQGTTAGTAYVAYCEEDHSLHFLCSESELTVNSTLDGGQKVTELWSGDDVTNSGYSNPQWTAKTDVTEVVFEESFHSAQPKSCCAWFNKLSNLEEIKGLENLDTENVTNMGSMFTGCRGLTSIDLSNFTTTNVTSMSYMFYDCSALTSIILSSNFNTSNVTNMGYMFSGCRGLTSIDLSSFNTEKVTSMSGMFVGCSGLTSLNLSSFNTEKVTSMLSMFYYCSRLTSLDLSKFNTSKVTNMNAMFTGCSNLRLLDLSKATIKDFSALEPSLPSSSLTFVPIGTTVTKGRKNVVVGNQCKHFVIDQPADANQQLLLSVPYTFTANKITINRNFTEGNPHTIYLPFAMNAQEHGKFYTYKNYDESTGDVTFSELTDTQTKPNRPYLFKPNQTGTIEITGEITVEPTPTKAQEESEGLVGVYTKKTFTEKEAEQNIYYGWAGGEFKRAGNGAKVDAGHAYLKLPAKAAQTAPMRLSVTLGGNGATAINATVNGANDESAPAYNLNGQRVGNGYRGMVIINGKKYIRK